MAVLPRIEQSRFFSDYEQRIYICTQAGELMASHFREGRNLILDVDGVILKADALHYPIIATPLLIPSLKLLENTGVKVGLATARGSHILSYLRSGLHGLALEGPLILEEGHALVYKGQETHISSSKHREFIKTSKRYLEQDRHYTQSWDEVVTKSPQTGELFFCHGNQQWQGDSRISLWYYTNNNRDRDVYLLNHVVEPILQSAARSQGIDFKNDISLSLTRMTAGNSLGIIGVKGKVDGNTIHKGIAANSIQEPWIFVADGFGDQPMAEETLKKNGLVIGIEGNLDESAEAGKFLDTANIRLRNPREFAMALAHAALTLPK